MKRLWRFLQVAALCAAVFVGSSLATPRPAYTFSEDGHYHFTFLLALMSGYFTWDEALLIAGGDWGQDMNATTVAETPSPDDIWSLGLAPFAESWAFHGLPWFKQVSWHALEPQVAWPGDASFSFLTLVMAHDLGLSTWPVDLELVSAAQRAQNINNRLAVLWDRQSREPDHDMGLVKFGQYLHYLQDTFAHAGSTAPLGHAIATLFYEDPDSLAERRGVGGGGAGADKLLGMATTCLAKMEARGLAMGRGYGFDQGTQGKLVRNFRALIDALVANSDPWWKHPGFGAAYHDAIVDQNILRIQQWIYENISPDTLRRLGTPYPGYPTLRAQHENLFDHYDVVYGSDGEPMRILVPYQYRIDRARGKILELRAFLAQLNCQSSHLEARLQQVEIVLRAAERLLELLRMVPRNLEGRAADLKAQLEDKIREAEAILEEIRRQLAPQILQFRANRTRVKPGEDVDLTLVLDHVCGSQALQRVRLFQSPSLGNAPGFALSVGLQKITLTVDTPKKAGVYSLQVEVTDKIGMQAMSDAISIEVVNVPPVVLKYPKEVTVRPGDANVPIDFTVRDDNAENLGDEEITITVEQPAAFEGKATGKFRFIESGVCHLVVPRIKMPLKDGSYPMTIRVRDRADKGPNPDADLIVENVAPEIKQALHVVPQAISPKPEGIQWVTVEVPFGDRNGYGNVKSAVLQIEVEGQIGGLLPGKMVVGTLSATGDATGMARFSFSVLGPKSGVLKLRVRVTDDNGAVGLSPEAVVRIENRPPEISIAGYGYEVLSQEAKHVCPDQLVRVGVAVSDINGDKVQAWAAVDGTKVALTDPDGNGIFTGVLQAPHKPGAYPIEFTAQDENKAWAQPRTVPLIVDECPGMVQVTVQARCEACAEQPVLTGVSIKVTTPVWSLTQSTTFQFAAAAGSRVTVEAPATLIVAGSVLVFSHWSSVTGQAVLGKDRPLSRIFDRAETVAAVYAPLVVANQPPVANPGGPYTATAAALPLPDGSWQFTATIALNGSQSRDPDGSIARYDWDFGDGQSGSGPGPSHTYTFRLPSTQLPGSVQKVFNACLTVTDNQGARHTQCATVTINAVVLGR